MKLSGLTLIAAIIVFLMETLLCIRFKSSEDNHVVRVNKKFLEESEIKDVSYYKEMMFKEISKHSSPTLDIMRTFNSTISATSNNLSDISLLKKKSRNDFILNSESINSDYVSKERTLKFYINELTECDVTIEDIIIFSNVTQNNRLIEHMILHNNADEIQPLEVTSSDINIISFAFNKKINIFSVFYDNPLGITEPKISFKYIAENLIKTMLSSERTRIDEKQRDNSTNSFIWKIVNQNSIDVNEKMKVEVIVDGIKNFNPRDINFSLNFTKIKPFTVKTLQNYTQINSTKVESNDGQNATSKDHFMYKYLWKGALKIHEVVILEVSFPMVFDLCGNININLFVVGIGAVFILFLIGMLFFIFSSIFFDEL